MVWHVGQPRETVYVFYFTLVAAMNWVVSLSSITFVIIYVDSDGI